MTGATPEGVRKSMVCHWAIAHEELKDVLAQDADISAAFVDRLYADQTNKNMPVTAAAAVKPVSRVNVSDVGVSSEDAVSVLRDGILYCRPALLINPEKSPLSYRVTPVVGKNLPVTQILDVPQSFLGIR